jgi:hypothetical protein
MWRIKMTIDEAIKEIQRKSVGLTGRATYMPPTK